MIPQLPATGTRPGPPDRARSRSRRAGHRVAMGLGLGLLAVSCGSQGADDVTTSISSPLPSPTAAPGSVSSPPTSETASEPAIATTTAPAVTDTRSVSEVLDSPAVEHGWPVSEGSWVVDSFDPAVSVDVDGELLVTRQSPNAVHFALPGSEGRATVTMLVPSAVLSPSGPVAMPTDLLEFAATLPNVEVSDSEDMRLADGRLIRNSTLRVLPPEGTPAFPCAIGPACVAVFVTEASELVNVPAGESFHILTTELDGVPLVVVAQAPDAAQLDAAEQIGSGLISSARTSATPARTDGPSFLAAAGVRGAGIPAGNHLAHLGSTVVDLELVEGAESTRLQLVEPRAIVMITEQLGSIALLRSDGFIDPGAELPPAGPRAFDRLLDDDPESASEFEEWLRRSVGIAASGTGEVGGRPANWWDVEIEPSLPSEPCGPRSSTGEGRCIDLIAGDVIRYVSDRNANRLYWVDGAEVIVHVTSVAPDGLDELLDATAPVFEALELRPVE